MSSDKINEALFTVDWMNTSGEIEKALFIFVRLIVNSVLVSTADRPEISINWRVYTKNPDNPLIRDLIIEGLSLARTQKEEFSSILSSNDDDIKALFKVLEDFSKN